MNGIFDTYLTARSVPSFPGEEEQLDRATGDGAAADAATGPEASDADTRGADEKRADILRGVFDRAARHPQTPSMGGAAPTVVVHVNARDLADGEGVGWADGVDAPVSMRTVRQLICAGGYRKVVFGENGVLLCWFHHHEIDCSGWQIRMVRGRPEIKAPPWLDRTGTWRVAAPHRAATASRPDRRRAA